jgi:hypothetical protein
MTMNKADVEAELEQLEEDIVALEGARSGMSETAFQMAMRPLQKRKAELEDALQAPASGTAYRADVSGGGAAAQGSGATAVGGGEATAETGRGKYRGGDAHSVDDRRADFRLRRAFCLRTTTGPSARHGMYDSDSSGIHNPVPGTSPQFTRR